MKKGIDVAKWQGNIEWEDVKEDGVEFAILKIINKANNVERSFERNYRNASENNLPLGVYNYSYASTVERARIDARKVLEVLDGKTLQYGVWLDIENKAQKGIGLVLVNIMNEYQKIITGAGYDFGVYTGLSFYNTYIKKYAAYISCPFWIARYPSNLRRMLTYNPCERKTPNILHDLFAWQYSSKGKVRGINGNVDLNLMYDQKNIFDVNAMAKEKSRNSYKVPTYTLYKGRKFQSKNYVMWLQVELGIVVDGIFGKETRNAVLAFQKRYGLVQDGKVGSITKKYLIGEI